MAESTVDPGTARGERIRRRRRRHNMSAQEDLAFPLGVDQTSISRAERGADSFLARFLDHVLSCDDCRDHFVRNRALITGGEEGDDE